ncbi:LOW QUALITY PROTEIN: 2-hydroxyacylsphingosine 1-beta-galactosyltransferase-like [Ctenocephalides felis]|uniref:LOW QUALITY PROTEIN: 2-hydroxyacylsphingosine 1-beta-galactosyltransferase-like n=1 Tax=Ctenocephalides felis TaxID=7515 RepID=UPI000E6E5BAC|nr:LOW QUALITY PROTEIN: 2-hydroxyacylsphingosine 1-beta-galactosyltransferase-like [Ctenocephalides felis]
MTTASDILMVTMGGTKSHKIPFWELARGLIPRGHNVTLLSAFPPTGDNAPAGLHEITPAGLVFYVKNYTDWDLVGARMRGEEPVSAWDIMRYGFESCDAMFNDAETHTLLRQSFDLLILDGAFPECALGLAHHYGVPFMYLNTVGFYMGSLSLAGNPAPSSVTPFLGRAFTDDMNIFDRALNTGWYIGMYAAHYVLNRFWLQSVLRKHLGEGVPFVYDLSRNVSFILQNGHHTVSYPRPYLPNVAEIACIHCKPARPLPQDLEDFISRGGDSGFIYVSMGSSVKAANMPDYLRRLLIRTFSKLPYRVLWKWEAGSSMMQDLPENVMLGRWLPQQDILGDRRLKVFVTHGGLLSMFESVYHGIPLVTMPVFCDHEANAAKAETDGYAYKLSLEKLTAERLYRAIMKVAHEPQFRIAALKRQYLLRDQKETPLERAIYWTEYVLRHKGAYHMQSPSRQLYWFQYYLFDVIGLIFISLAILVFSANLVFKFTFKYGSTFQPAKIKVH